MFFASLKHILYYKKSMADITNYIDENKSRYEEELMAFLRIPSISTSPEHKGEVRRCAQPSTHRDAVFDWGGRWRQLPHDGARRGQVA